MAAFEDRLGQERSKAPLCASWRRAKGDTTGLVTSGHITAIGSDLDAGSLVATHVPGAAAFHD
jgi:hypothetical protein